MFTSVSRALIPVKPGSRGACVTFAHPEQRVQTEADEMEVHFPVTGEEKVWQRAGEEG